MASCMLPCWTVVGCIVIALLGNVGCLPTNHDNQSTDNIIPVDQTGLSHDEFEVVSQRKQLGESNAILDVEKDIRSTPEGFANTDGRNHIWNQEQSLPDNKHNHDAVVRFENGQFTSEDKRLSGDPHSNSVCGDQLCYCFNDSADCSMHPDGIPYVPILPEYIAFVNLSYNSIQNITDDFFTNITAIQRLALSDNDLQYISPGSFQVFDNLQALHIDYNRVPLNYRMLQPVVKTSSIQVLFLKNARLVNPIPSGFFNNLPKLRVLQLLNNILGNNFNLGDFAALQNLTVLGLDGNRISQLTVDAAMDSLDCLNISKNWLLTFPQTCQGSSQQSLFPRLTHLYMNTNHIKSIPKEICLPSLQLLDLAHNDILVIPTDAFGSSKFPRLQDLFLTAMTRHVNIINASAFNNTNLKQINLVQNNLKLYDENAIHADAFANCTSLNNLRISHNFMIGVSAERFVQLFGHLDQITDLHIDSCQLYEINRQMLSPFRKVVNVYLNRNSLTQLADGTFDDLLELQQLNLDINQISVVSPNLFSPPIRQKLKQLDLSGNPFECSCSVLWFRDWMISQPSLFHSIWGQYNCSNIPGLGVVDFVMSPQACLFSHTAYVIIAVVSGLVIAAYTSFVLAYRYRWHFRLILYEAFRGTGDARRRHLARNDFDFDLFVCYESKDLPWVRQHLMPQMEDRLGLKLCVHQRDFIVGKYISENISDSVDKSKKVMMLFSTHFAQSQWCQFELALCLRHVMDHDDDLIIVCLDDVSSRDMTGTMMAVLKTTTYIQWEENNEDAVGAFWGRLNIALQEIIPRRPAA